MQPALNQDPSFGFSMEPMGQMESAGFMDSMDAGAMPPVKERTSTEKVAILLAALENSLAVNVLQKLDPEDVKLILESSNKLGPLKSEDVEPVVDEFAQEFSSALGISAGSEQFLALLESAFTADQVAALLGRPVPKETAGGESVWSRFKSGIETTLVPYLLDEHEQTAAYIIFRLQPELAAKCLTQFPRTTRNNIVSRLLKMGAVEPVANAVLEEVLEQDLFGAKTTPKEDGAMRDKLAAVVNRLDRQQSMEILEDLGSTSPDDVKAIRKLIFMFEDIPGLDHKHRLRLFDRVPTELVISALFGMDDAFREAVLTSMGARARRMVESELQGDTSKPKPETEPARRKIADTAIQMARKGEIEFPEPPEEKPAEAAAAEAPAA